MGPSCSLGILRVCPARKTSLFGRIINPLFTKLVRSLFAFLSTSTSSRSIKTQRKNSADMQLHLDVTLKILYLEQNIFFFARNGFSYCMFS